MTENMIVALVGLIASAVICYGFPQQYFTPNAKQESASYSYNQQAPCGTVSLWQNVPVAPGSEIKRENRDLEAVQPKQCSYNQYQQYDSQIPAPYTVYSWSPEIYRAVRQSIPTVPYAQNPQSSTTETQYAQQPAANSVVPVVPANYYQSYLQNSSIPQYDAYPPIVNPQYVAYNPAQVGNYYESSNPQTLPNPQYMLPAPIMQNEYAAPNYYEGANPPFIPLTPADDATPVANYYESPNPQYREPVIMGPDVPPPTPIFNQPNNYYYPPPMMRGYSQYPYMINEERVVSADDEDDDDDKGEDNDNEDDNNDDNDDNDDDKDDSPSENHYILYDPKNPPPGIQRNKIFPIPPNKLGETVTPVQLKEVMKRAIAFAQQQRRQRNTFLKKSETKDDLQTRTPESHGKHENSNSESSSSVTTITPESKFTPQNSTTKINLKDILKEPIMVRGNKKPVSVENNKGNEKSSSENDDEDSWGINEREQEKSKITGFDEKSEKENEEKIENFKRINLKNMEELERLKKEVSKYLEAEEMKKDEKIQDNEKKSSQIMRIPKSKSQIQKSDSIESSTSTESSPKVI